ncbi:nickel-dependent hydrogenase large subunit [Clostridium cylindrosporum]|uniref:Ni,Fe-hydrogenase I large subunit n=1 Tax=Clostridium cylindrosporum DSM 605 TaxID=1121307 RepID=A0A0J8G3F8_CLOCY|nr:nickel-dependent hydrogenase large subunit [Clostridium cylindrosporum]KMT22241.1 Ni,Fe-hydrogenase I large subunit [Clostridium cylindrosporum DSM 605]
MKIVIDPVTRVSGLLKIEVEVEGNKVVSAKSSGGQFRGFEKMFQGRDPLDAIWLSPRVCGICSTHHTLAATLALENALNVAPDFNGVVVREIANGFEFLQNHLRQIYFFTLPDFVQIDNVSPLYKTISPNDADYRLPINITAKLNGDYVKAVKYSRDAHRAAATIIGKVPHGHGIFVGGTTIDMNVQQMQACLYTVREIKEFIEGNLLEDINIIASYYKDYYTMGAGPQNFMSYGLYDNPKFPVKYVSPGVILKSSTNQYIREEFDRNNITESIKNSWLIPETGNQTSKPGTAPPPSPNAYKEGAYSWVAAARYKGHAMEGGPLARMILSGIYTRGVSVMDRIIARALEARKICECIESLLAVVKLGPPYQEKWKVPEKAFGVGLTDASRGTLGHWVNISGGKIANYTLIPPSTWNLGPTDEKGVLGTVEQALIGTTINNVQHPVEIGRIVRSFDPCLNCAAHITSDRYSPFEINLV